MTPRLLLALALAAPAAALAATRYVGGCGTPTTATIAAAVAAASAGDTLLVCPGSYDEAVTVNKDGLTIAGSTGNRAQVTVSNRHVPFTLTGAGATLKDMTIASGNDKAVSRPWARSPAAYTFDNLAITAKDKGIHIVTSTKVSLTHVEVTSSHDDAIRLDSSSDGEHVFDTVTVTAKKVGIYSYNGGVSFKHITASAGDEAIYIHPKYAAEFSDISATSEKEAAINLGWVASGKAHGFADVTATAKKRGIFVDVSEKLTFTNVTATSQDDDAIHLGGSTSGAHEFDHVTASGKKYGIRSYNGGASFKHVTASAEDDDALYLLPKYDAELSDITATARQGNGINLAWVASGKTLTLINLNVDARKMGVQIDVAAAVTIRDSVVKSSHNDAIHLRYGAQGAHTLDHLTLEAENGAGIRFEARVASSSIGNVCVNASQYGVIVPQWHSRALSITGSRFTSSVNGVRIESDPAAPYSVTGNCILKASAPRAYTTGKRHDFDGNYWDGVAGGGVYVDGNVRDNATLASCPVTSCYAASAPAAAPVAEWRMDEAAWNGTAGEARDAAGSTHGTAKNGAATAEGKLCRAGAFDGSDDRLEMPIPAAGLSKKALSVAMWVKFDRVYLEHQLFYIGAPETSRRRYLYVSTWTPNGTHDGIHVGTLTTSGTWGRSYASNTRYFEVDRWYHVVGVVDTEAGKIKVYRDGVLIVDYAIATGDIPGTPADIWIGSTPEGYQHLDGLIDEVKLWDGALSADQIAAGHANEAAGNNWDGSARACAAAVSLPGAFNAFETATAAGSIAGYIKTKVAGSPYSLDVVALNAGLTAQDGAFAGTVKLEVLGSASASPSLDAAGCPVGAVLLASPGEASVSGGRASVAFPAEPDAWRYAKLRVSYPATGGAERVSCSGDMFAIRPASLGALAQDADWASAGSARTLDAGSAAGTPVHKAGRPFSLKATGYNTAGAVTPRYDGNPDASLLSCVLPASGCVAGRLSAGGFSGAGGTVTSDTASYSEAGAISLRLTDSGFAAVDADDGTLEAERAAVSAAITVGRFVPDHLDLATNTPAFAPACGSFSYVGQPFGLYSAPVWTVTAKNAAGTTTVNYAGGLWKLAADGVSGQAWSAAAGSARAVASLPEPVVAELGDGQGGITFAVGDAAAGGGLVLARAGPVAPFDARLTLSASVADSDGVAYSGNPHQHADIGFDDGHPLTGHDAQMRYGRLRLAHAAGSELRPLPMSLTAQYWDGRGFFTNPLDFCTALDTPGLGFYAQGANNRLASGETGASLAAPLVAGNAGLRLSAPGAGNHGYLEVTLTAPTWLRYNWDGVDQPGDDHGLYDDSPHARAAFGKRKGRDKVIIRREIY